MDWNNSFKPNNYLRLKYSLLPSKFYEHLLEHLSHFIHLKKIFTEYSKNVEELFSGKLLT